MKKIATPHFDFESKKVYIQPEMDVVIMDSCTLLAGSSISIVDGTEDIINQDAPGLLMDDLVESPWSESSNVW